MKKQLYPQKGLAVLSSYSAYTRIGGFKVIDIENGELIADKRFENVVTNDAIMVLLGVCAACEFAIANSYNRRIFCSNTNAYRWAFGNTFNPKGSSRRMIKLVKKNLPTIQMGDVASLITLWNKQWGNMQDYIDLLLMDNRILADLPF